MAYFKSDSSSIPLYYELHGTKIEDRPIIIFVNGWCLSGQYWAETIERLASQYLMLTYDSVGFGRSRGEIEPTYRATIDSEVALLAELVEKLELTLDEKTLLHVVGHSLGGVIASRYATQLETRSKLAGLTIINSGSFEEKEQTGNRLIPFVKIFVATKSLFSLPIIRKAVVGRSIKQPVGQKYESVIVQDLVQAEPRLSLELSLSSLEKRNLDLYEKELKDLKAPLLLIVGDRDATIPPKGMYNIKKFKPESKLEAFPDCGHLPMLEKPDVFASTLEKHFALAGSKGDAYLEPNAKKN